MHLWQPLAAKVVLKHLIQLLSGKTVFLSHMNSVLFFSWAPQCSRWWQRRWRSRRLPASCRSCRRCRSSFPGRRGSRWASCRRRHGSQRQRHHDPSQRPNSTLSNFALHDSRCRPGNNQQDFFNPLTVLFLLFDFILCPYLPLFFNQC